MPFDLNTWKEKYQERLPGWRERMKAAGVNSAYYFITASTFLPIAQALQSGNIEAYGFAAISSSLSEKSLSCPESRFLADFNGIFTPK